MKREHWNSKLGFILSVAGSAIGLANIWRFPYVVGNHGGAAFIFLYLVCLLAIGLPTFITEIAIGRKTQQNPATAFAILGQNKTWGLLGKITVLTGFIVSVFYAAVAGWILGYLWEAIKGTLVSFPNPEIAFAHYTSLTDSPTWVLGFHLLFLLFCVSVLYYGVKQGIEKANKFFMPLLFTILLILVIKGLTLPHSLDALSFLLNPNWSELTASTLLIALGQSFFTLSIGQGTLVTYGSYLSQEENLIQSSYPVIIMDTLVSIFSAIAVFTIVFSVGAKPEAGPSLIFNTLPLVFSQISGGYFLSILFFLLVFVAALTSEISALEPMIAYLTDEWKWSRKVAVISCSGLAFILGIPCSLSTNLLKEMTVFGFPNFLEFLMFLCSNILIPLGGLSAVLLAGWKWGIANLVGELHLNSFLLKNYFHFAIKYLSPLLIIIVFLSAIGFFN